MAQCAVKTRQKCYINDQDLIFMPERPGSNAHFHSTVKKVSLASRYDGLPFATFF